MTAGAASRLHDHKITCKHLESLGAVQLLLNLLTRHVTCAGLHLQQHQRPLCTTVVLLVVPQLPRAYNAPFVSCSANHCLPCNLSFTWQSLNHGGSHWLCMHAMRSAQCRQATSGCAALPGDASCLPTQQQWGSVRLLTQQQWHCHWQGGFCKAAWCWACFACCCMSQ